MFSVALQLALAAAPSAHVFDPNVLSAALQSMGQKRGKPDSFLRTLGLPNLEARKVHEGCKYASLRRGIAVLLQTEKCSLSSIPFSKPQTANFFRSLAGMYTSRSLFWASITRNFVISCLSPNYNPSNPKPQDPKTLNHYTLNP